MTCTGNWTRNKRNILVDQVLWRLFILNTVTGVGGTSSGRPIDSSLFASVFMVYPGLHNPVDMTIEQRINHQAKSAGGIVGVGRNFPAYLTEWWCVTRHARTSYVVATFKMAGMDDSDDSILKHLRPAKIQQSEEGVTKLCKAFGQFINPFDIECRDALYCLSSGTLPAVENELLKVDEFGEAIKDFVQTRLVEKTAPFHSPLKKQKLKTMCGQNCHP